jgi:hypothetical protein
MTAGDGPASGEPDVLAYVSASLSDALAAIDVARSAVGTALVWTKIAEDRGGDGNGDNGSSDGTDDERGRQ